MTTVYDRSVGPIWFPGVKPKVSRTNAISLVCFPHAGGTPTVFRGWDKAFGAGVQVVPVLLAGRCIRLNEQPSTSIPAMATHIGNALICHGHADRYALLGHSMGALLAYEVACVLRDRGAPAPTHYFIWASRAPHRYGQRTTHTLPDADLIRMVHELGGIRAADGMGRANLSHRLPALRADLQACETYRWAPRSPLDVPMTAFCGSDDLIATARQIDEWCDYTSRSFVRTDFTSDHFFLTGQARRRLVDRLRLEVCRAHSTSSI